jgi:hypothetical protein
VQFVCVFDGQILRRFLRLQLVSVNFLLSVALEAPDEGRVRIGRSRIPWMMCKPSACDNTRKIRQPKTKASSALLPMSSALEAVLRNNAGGILFATRNGLRPQSRDNDVKCGLKPALRQLGIPSANTWTSDGAC